MRRRPTDGDISAYFGTELNEAPQASYLKIVYMFPTRNNVGISR